jgi:hypothetical protein
VTSAPTGLGILAAFDLIFLVVAYLLFDLILEERKGHEFNDD